MEFSVLWFCCRDSVIQVVNSAFQFLCFLSFRSSWPVGKVIGSWRNPRMQLNFILFWGFFLPKGIREWRGLRPFCQVILENLLGPTLVTYTVTVTRAWPPVKYLTIPNPKHYHRVTCSHMCIYTKSRTHWTHTRWLLTHTIMAEENVWAYKDRWLGSKRKGSRIKEWVQSERWCEAGAAGQ